MNILHLDSSILGDNSVSRQLSAAVVQRLSAADMSATVTYRDLAADPLSHLTGLHLAASQGLVIDHLPDLRADIDKGTAVLTEFLAADIIVLGTAFYNLSISSMLKAWIDRIIIAGQTFRYTAEGAIEGLMGSKRIILCVSRGGIYSEGAPHQSFEHCETYLKSMFGFIGVTKIDVILAEGVNIGPEFRQSAIEGALERVASIAV